MELTTSEGLVARDLELQILSSGRRDKEVRKARLLAEAFVLCTLYYSPRHVLAMPVLA